MPSREGVERLLELLAEFSFLTPATLHGFRGSIELYQVSDDCLKLALAVEARRQRCGVCSLVIPDAPSGVPCPRCHGTLAPFTDAEVERSRYAQRAMTPSTVPLNPEEHTAQVSTERRKEIEEAFKSRDLPTNLLACTPTLEMGIDVGGLDAIMLRNIPPRPDNYAQRGGRAGRRSRVGLVVGYARATPHEQYFFDHAAEMIAGAVPAPIFLLGNQDAITRHLHAIACGLSEPGLPSRMGDLVTFEGRVIQEELDPIKAGLRGIIEPALAIARDAFGPDVLVEAGFDDSRMRTLLERLPDRIQDAIDRTALQIQRLRSVLDVLYTTGERQREANRATVLIKTLLGTLDSNDSVRSADVSSAYPLRRLAEFGLLPGYEFPSEPATLRLMGDEDEQTLVQTGRELGLRQYQPNAPVYARGRRWKVIGVDLSSPWNPAASQATWHYVRCGRRGSIRDAQSDPRCSRCRTAGAAAEAAAIAYGGFLARLDNTSASDEEERWGAKDNVQVHPSWDAEQVAGRWDLSDDWRLEWRRAEKIFRLNEGPEQDGLRRSYSICQDCGKVLAQVEEPPAESRRRGGRVPARVSQSQGADPYEHGPSCPRRGQPVTPVALFSQKKVDTLRLLFPWPGRDEDHESLAAWAWTLGYALLAGAERLFALSTRDFEVVFEGTRPFQSGTGPTPLQAILTFVDPNLGGSGYLERFARRLPEVAVAALQHLDHEDCETACYRCLKSYDNQRHHARLSWPLVTSTLEGLREDPPVAVATSAQDLNDPRPWREAFEAGVGSPLEFRCWTHMQAAGLNPVKQFPITDPDTRRLLTIADFAFPEECVSIYVDGASIHVGNVLRRDRRIEQRLHGMEPSWTVIRLGRSQIDHHPGEMIERIRAALGST